MSTSTINSYVAYFESAFAELGKRVPVEGIERLATTVHQTMESPQRRYHNSRHIFEMCEGVDGPLLTLAALFHDLVYVQLDGGYPRCLASELAAVATSGEGGYVLRPVPPGDTGLTLCAGIFAFRAGDALPIYGGLNEFLSAVAAVRLLSPYLTLLELLGIVAAIEATIPFRAGGAEGGSLAGQLASRVRSTAGHLGLALSADELENVVVAAFQLANRDVSGFAVLNPARFLAATWMLIEESNAPLAQVGVYSIRDYRQALARMNQFLSSLNAEHIFHGHRGRIPPESLRTSIEAARRNLDFSVRYIDAKLVSIALIEALALESGGDAPISMLLGDISVGPNDRTSIAHFLDMPAVDPDAIDPMLLALFEEGRPGEVRSDMAASPLTAYLYRWLGDAGMRACAEAAKHMFAGLLTPREFLCSIRREPVDTIRQACAEISPTRRHRLLALAL